MFLKLYSNDGLFSCVVYLLIAECRNIACYLPAYAENNVTGPYTSYAALGFVISRISNVSIPVHSRVNAVELGLKQRYG